MNSSVRIKEESHQEVAIVKEEPVDDTVTIAIATTGESASQQADLQSGVQCKQLQVKVELLHEDDSLAISSKQATNPLFAVKGETCPCDCDVCLEALRSASNEAMVTERVENVSVASTFNSQTLTRTDKRSIGQSGNSSTPKRARNVPFPTVAAQLEHQVDDDSQVEENDESESENISLSVLVRYLNCRVPGCRKKFKNKVQYGHLLAKHAIEKYVCIVKDCTESYATKAEFKVHRDTVHGHLGTNWPCGQCETICTNYPKLCKHVYLYYVSGLFSCSADKCNYTETTRIKVQIHHAKHRPARHRPAKHRPAKYGCTFAGCTSSFPDQFNLTSHFRTHTKEKPFLCSQCPKAFSQKSNLTVHELIHSGLKPYSCTWPHCDYSAKRQSSVIRHVRTVHFHLPPTKKEQTEKCIIDDRDPCAFVSKSVSTGY